MPGKSCARFGPATCTSSLDGIAAPPAFEFSASNASGTAREGDELPAAGGPVRLRVRSNAPASFTTTIRNGAGILSGDHREPEFTVEAPGGAGVYWVEVRAADKPWLMSNPIYVRAANSPAGTTERRRAPAIQQQSLIGGPSKTSWHVEYDPTSLAAVDLPQATPGPGGTGGSQRGCDSGSPTDQPRCNTPRSSWIWRQGSLGTIAWCSRAAQNSPCGFPSSSDRRGSWARSVYLDTVDQERTVFSTTSHRSRAPARTSRHAPKSAPSCS